MKSLVVKARRSSSAGTRPALVWNMPFWQAFKDIAALRNMTLSDLLMSIDAERQRQSIVGHSPVRLGILSQPEFKRRRRARPALLKRHWEGQILAMLCSRLTAPSLLASGWPNYDIATTTRNRP